MPTPRKVEAAQKDKLCLSYKNGEQAFGPFTCHGGRTFFSPLELLCYFSFIFFVASFFGPYYKHYYVFFFYPPSLPLGVSNPEIVPSFISPSVHHSRFTSTPVRLDLFTLFFFFFGFFSFLLSSSFFFSFTLFFSHPLPLLME